jgi:hypothetical protein
LKRSKKRREIMDKVWIPFLSALLGGIIASIASIVSIILQARFQAQRERGRLAMEAAIEEHKLAVDAAKTIKGRRVEIAPFSAYLIDSINLLKLAEKDRLTPENLRHLHIKMEEIRKVIEEDSEEHVSHQDSDTKTEKPGL